VNQQMRISDQERQSDSATFQVILKGLRADAPLESREKMAALFKASLEQIDKLLAAPEYVVKKDISFDVASKYKRAIEAAGGVCELSSEEEFSISIDVDLPSVESLTAAVKSENKDSSFRVEAPASQSAKAASSPHVSVGAAAVNSVDGNPVKAVIENLEVLKHKISKNTAYLGVLVGMGIFAFSFFLSWASIPTGQMARDGGSVTGWSEKAYLALFPLAFALYPVFLQKSVQLKNLLINIVIAFALLGYNNVANRTTWNNNYGNMGSTLDVGFWIGFLAMVAISACGIAWSLHTNDLWHRDVSQASS
jgi:hypothetical protein